MGLRYFRLPKGYDRETRDAKFRWLMKHHYERGEYNGKFDFRHPNHGSIHINENTGDCLVWGSFGDGVIFLLPMKWEGFGFNRFKNYVVSAWGAKHEYEQRALEIKKQIKTSIDSITIQSSASTVRSEQ